MSWVKANKIWIVTFDWTEGHDYERFFNMNDALKRIGELKTKKYVSHIKMYEATEVISI